MRLLNAIAPAGCCNFASLTEREILALAISAEEEDARIYLDDAGGLRAEHSASAAVFDGMAVKHPGPDVVAAEMRRRGGDSF